MPKADSSSVARELLLDYAAFRDGEFRLADTPRREVDEDPDTAEGWAQLYGGMVSYESALDAAGYERESEMDAPDAPVLVMLCDIDGGGTISFTDFRPGVQVNDRKRQVSADQILGAAPDRAETPAPS